MIVENFGISVTECLRFLTLSCTIRKRKTCFPFNRTIAFPPFTSEELYNESDMKLSLKEKQSSLRAYSTPGRVEVCDFNECTNVFIDHHWILILTHGSSR